MKSKTKKLQRVKIAKYNEKNTKLNTVLYVCNLIPPYNFSLKIFKVYATACGLNEFEKYLNS